VTAHDQYRDDLSLYAVGALPREESESLDRHLAECAACREELRVLNEAAAQIAMAVDPAAPPARLRERLAASLRNEEIRPTTRDDRSASASRLRPGWFWAPAFAAAILAVAVAVLWIRNRAALQVNQELTAELESTKEAAREARSLIRMLSANDAQHITLVAAGTRPQPEAKAVYSLPQRSLVLLASNLSPLPPHKVYELWLLPASGAQPIPAGTFRPDAHGSATLVSAPFARAVPAKGFAVTVENEPGAATPTLPIVLSGTS
jgi:anti-sigma-K factor RskA